MYHAKTMIASVVLLPTLLCAEIVSVHVKQTLLRTNPSFVSPSLSTLTYAEQVESQKSENGWKYVTSLKSGTLGWVHESALSSKTIVLQNTSKLSNTSVSQSEVLMAGKGFNKEVEKEYKKQHTTLNFTLVDQIEKTPSLQPQQLTTFANNGKLSL
jgi:SH3-like domain-containing protein